MSQLFTLQLAPDTLSADAQQIGVPSEQLQKIRIRVSISIVQQPEQQLWFDYQVQLPSAILATQLNWPSWQQSKVKFTDYLWEQTCLECFISSNTIGADEIKDSSYIEINASPDGQYALYKFKDYRTPSTLPPTPLMQSGCDTKAYITWADNLSSQKIKKTASLYPNPKPTKLATNLTTAEFTPYYQYQCSFGLSLVQFLPESFDHDWLNNDLVAMIHPCVILQFGETNLYFAPNHATPPDFHNRHHWSRLKLYKLNSNER